jgi:hypothetical protein
MKIAWWTAAVAGALFLGWAHDHTDEIPIVFGFVLLVGGILGALGPGRFFASWAIASAPVPVVETLVRFHVMTAPWPAGEASPLNALVAAVPALIGVGIGAGLRKAIR